MVGLMAVDSRAVRLYTRGWCGYCVAARRLLTKLEIEFDEVPLDDDPELRRSLSEANSHWPTLPMIFVGEDFIGGYTELSRLVRRGRMNALLEGLS